MRLTRRGFIGSMLAVLTAGVGGFLGLAQADVEPVFDTKDAKFRVRSRMTGKELARSARMTLDRQAAQVLNNAFTTVDDDIVFEYLCEDHIKAISGVE